MNKNELKGIFKNLKVGDTLYNLKIEGLNQVETDAVLQELARRNCLQFEIKIDSGSFIYEVLKPSKKFLNKEGQWKTRHSKKVEEFLKDME